MSPPAPAPQLFLVEDDEAALFGYEQYLSGEGYTITTATTLNEAKDIAAQQRFDVILLDLKLPDGDAVEWLPELKNTHPHTPVIVITGVNDIPTAVKATKNGAENYMTKPIEMESLAAEIAKVIQVETLKKKDLAQNLRYARSGPFFGESEAAGSLMHYAQVAASNNAVILLHGETGTGKGVLAKWIHEHSHRASQPLVELNCSSLKGDLLRSELFGHTKGAFTSAIKNKEGMVEVADGGTLFLDEIGDMDIEVQAQLLKTIEEKSFRRVGENKLRKSDFRLICATNRDLLQATEDGAFRKDLYYRICVFPITVPPLREREQDIRGFASHFLNEFGYVHGPLCDEVMQLLLAYDWPGNIRELRNMLERALLLSQGSPLAPQHFPGLEPTTGSWSSSSTSPDRSSDSARQHKNLSEVEKEHLQAIVNQYNGDKKKASEAMGISLSTLYRKLNRA